MRRSDLQVWISAESCNGLQNSKHRHDTPLWFASLELRMQNFARFVRRSDLQIWNSAESCNDLQNSKRRHDSCGALICKFGTMQSLAMAYKIQNVGTIRAALWFANLEFRKVSQRPTTFKTSARFVRRSDLQVWNSAESRNGLRIQNVGTLRAVLCFTSLELCRISQWLAKFKTPERFVRHSDLQVWNSAKSCNVVHISKLPHDSALWPANLELCRILQWPAKFKTLARYGALICKSAESCNGPSQIQNVGTTRAAQSDLQV